jgi:2-keto-4-pentenoate hydratase/2-oxohepta-3-ene-1,7-dioic acid hydratase in catechol pathway
MEYVVGYTILNDVSARDVQLGKDGGIIMGKHFDTSAPLGPCLVLTDEIPDPANVRVRTWVNGNLRQDSTTHQLIFDVPAIIAFLTQQTTRDMIATGTPSGVGLGMKPQVWLQPGDKIPMEIEGIGVLKNGVIGG